MKSVLDHPETARTPHGAPWTPWGPSQDQTVIAEGVVFHATASHGGYKLSHKRWAELVRTFPEFQPFARYEYWLEEDCDAARVPMLWPEEFPDQACQSVHRSVLCAGRLSEFSDVPDEYYSSQSWLSIVVRAANWRSEHYFDWEVGSMSGDRFGWTVHLTRVGDDQTRTIRLEDYPAQRLYTADEVTAIDLRAVAR